MAKETDKKGITINLPHQQDYSELTELKLKMSQNEQFFMFEISALPPEGTFQMLTHFSIYGHLVKKAMFKFLKDGLVLKQSNKMYQGCLIFSDFSTMYSRYP